MRQERTDMRMAGYIVGIGAANLDVHGRSINSIRLRDSNPGRLNMSAGGVTRNILENMSLRNNGEKTFKTTNRKFKMDFRIFNL